MWQPHLSFHIDQDLYALPLNQVRELVDFLPSHRPAGHLANLRGIMNLRGSVIPLVDVRESLGLPSPLHGQFKMVLIVEAAGASAGLIVDGISEVVSLADYRVTALPASFSRRVAHGFLTGLAERADQTLLLLDAERVVQNEPHSQWRGEQSDV